MDLSKFLAASAAAEQTLDFLTTADKALANARVIDAKACLQAAGIAARHFGPNLDACRDEIASVAEGKIVRNPVNGPAQHHSSHHEVVGSIWSILQHTPTGAHLRPGFLDRLGVDCSAVRAGLIRERAKLRREAKLSVAVGHGQQKQKRTG